MENILKKKFPIIERIFLQYYLYKLLFFVVFSIFFINCKNSVSQKCNNICNYSLQCSTKSINPILIKPKDLDNFKIQCYNTCTMLQDDFMECYQENKNSCGDYFTCLVKSGTFE